eukprot:357211-Chlamydomonas_euryale.AAC.2
MCGHVLPVAGVNGVAGCRCESLPRRSAAGTSKAANPGVHAAGCRHQPNAPDAARWRCVTGSAVAAVFMELGVAPLLVWCGGRRVASHMSPIPQAFLTAKSAKDLFTFHVAGVVQPQQAPQKQHQHQAKRAQWQQRFGSTSAAPAATMDAQMLQDASRHRWRFGMPSTPDGFWDIGFGDSQDSR